MAQGTVVFFDQWLVDVAEAKQDHELGTFYLGLIHTVTPTATASDPRWGAGGGTNYATNDLAAGGNYAANGAILNNPSVTLSGGAAEIDFDDPATWSKNASNPTNALFGIIYNNQAAKECVGFVDLGGVFDMTTGDLTVTWNAPCATLDQAA